MLISALQTQVDTLTAQLGALQTQLDSWAEIRDRKPD